MGTTPARPAQRPRQPLTGLALAAAAGVTLAEWRPVPVLWSALAMLLALAIVFVRPRTVPCWLLALAAFHCLHLLRTRDTAALRLAARWARGPQVVEAVGIVWSEPETRASRTPAGATRFTLKLLSLQAEGCLTHPSALVQVHWTGPPPEYGDSVRVRATASNLEGPRNPGQFDFRRHLQRQGICSELGTQFPSDCRRLGSGHGWAPMALGLRARTWISQRLELGLADAPDISALIQSMVLGMRGETPPELKELFQKTGTMHLFAVSGLNVAMLGTLAWFLLKPLRIGRKAAVLVVAPLLCGYALVTGLGASSLRATFMGLIVLGAVLVERPVLVFNNLAAAALVILAFDTSQLFLPGFQLSFALVAAIVSLAPPIQRRLEPFTQPDPFLPRALWRWPQTMRATVGKALSATLGVTIAAWLGSFAFTAAYFHLFSPASLLANLLAVPIAFLILALGLGAVLCAGVWTTGAIWLNNANWLFARTLIWLVQVFAHLPGGHCYLEMPAPPFRRRPELTVLDMGQGAAVHLRARPGEWLLDCGHARGYGAVLLPYLRSRGVNHLSGLLLSHGDARHVGAALDVMEEFTPDQVVDSPLKDRSPTRRAIHRALAARARGKTILARGDVLPLNATTRLRVLYPPRGRARTVADDQALVVRLECNGVRVLFTADSGFATEQWLVENEPDLAADLLVKGQHERDLSGSPDFMRRVAPRAVICTEAVFGCPPEALDTWAADQAAHGIAVFRQDRCGAVSVFLSEGALELRAFLNGQIFRSRAR